MMNFIAIRLIVFACVFGAVLFGMFLRAVLPEQHLSADSKDTVRLGIGVIATMAALVLGLLVASAKNFYDAQSSELTQMSANVLLLDRVLAHYGPETKEARDLLRGAVRPHPRSDVAPRPSTTFPNGTDSGRRRNYL
jgi:hypothetical protein